MVRRHHIPLRVLAPLLAAAALAVVIWAPGAADGAPDPERLQRRIEGQRERERSLASAAERLGRLERAAGREVRVLARRVADVQQDLARAQTRLQDTQARLRAARRRAERLRARLGQVRGKLAALLRERYVSGRPDMVTVVIEADGFNQLLETMSFLRRVEARDTELLALVRRARTEAVRERRTYIRLERMRRSQAQTLSHRRNALVSIQTALQARRAALSRARAARLLALRGTRSDRRRAERTLSRLLAQRARAQRAVGPGGPWAIPWPVVQCESGGQNLPPNYATASGYYQILDETWAGLGGSTKHAYQASKAEQDRLAARLWDGGRGAHNWVCAVLIGIA